MTVSEEERRLGLVFVNRELPPGQAATHVLILGVGAYPTSNLKPLTSPAISAATIAGWFLGRQADGVTPVPNGFRNDAKPLGSLALLMSDPADPTDPNSPAKPAQFANVEAPCATMANAKLAFEAWVRRARANRDSLAVLYLSGHGIHDERHTAFVLEDRNDEDGSDLTNGLIDLTVFIRRMARLPIRSQLLLFDCCRSKVDLNLPDEGQVGEAFLKQEASAGPDIQQMALFATVPFDVAWGRTGMLSLYAESLIMAFTHAAADKKMGSWIVSSADLFGEMQSCLQLFATAEQRFQRLGAESLADFPIHVPTISATEVPTYVSLVDPSRWDEAEFVLTCEGKDKSLRKVARQRFISVNLRREVPVTIVATYEDGTTEAFEGEPDRPVMFARVPNREFVSVCVVPKPASRTAAGPEILEPDVIVADALGGVSKGDSPTVAPRLPGRVADASKVLRQNRRRGGDEAELRIVVRAGAGSRAAGVLSLADDDASRVRLLDLAEGRRGVAVAPGRYKVSLTVPDGRTLARSVEVGASEIAALDLDIGSEGSAWLMPAKEAGLVPATLDVAGRGPGTLPAGFNAEFLSPLRFGKRASIAEGDVGASFGTPLQIAGPVLRLDIRETVGTRFRSHPDRLSEHPLWVRVSAAGVEFDLAVPAVGTECVAAGWAPHVVTLVAEGRGSAVGLADPGPAAPLFAFLGRREFVLAARALETLLGSGAGRAAISGDENPVVSAAAAIANIATGTNAAILDDEWHDAFVEQHPSLPDARVLAARRIRWRGEAAAREGEVRELLLGAYRAGVPVFALALDWLASDLAEFEDEAMQTMADEARRLSRRAAPSSLFTAIRRNAGG